jgi:hypothetical protein
LYINEFNEGVNPEGIFYAIIPVLPVTHWHGKQLMNKKVASKAVSGDKRIRRTQARAENTRSKLLEAATAAFSERGYDGVSVRDIENKAGVKRGLLGYHFGDKKLIWIAVVDNTFGLMKTAVNKRMELLQDLGGRDRGNGDARPG